MASANSPTPLAGASKSTFTDSANDQVDLSRAAAININALGLIRTAVGVTTVLAPQFAFRIFGFSLPATAAFTGHMIGARDLVVGELTLTANKEPRDRRELRRILWANIAVDALDVGTAIVCLARGTLSRTAAGALGGGAAVFVAMGVAGLRSL